MKVSKNSKYRTNSKEYQTQKKPKRRNWRARGPKARAPGALKRESFCIFQHPLLQNIKKLKGEPFDKIFSKKNLTMPKKLKEGTL